MRMPPFAQNLSTGDLRRLAGISESIRAQAQRLAQFMVDQQYASAPEALRKFGQEGYEKSLSDAVHNLDFLAESVALGDPSVFADYIAWLRNVLDKAGVPAGVLRTHLICMADVLAGNLPSDTSSVPLECVSAAAALLDAAPEAARTRETP